MDDGHEGDVGDVCFLPAALPEQVTLAGGHHIGQQDLLAGWLLLLQLLAGLGHL